MIKREVFTAPERVFTTDGQIFTTPRNAREPIDKLNDFCAANGIRRTQIISVQESQRGDLVIFYAEESEVTTDVEPLE